MIFKINREPTTGRAIVSEFVQNRSIALFTHHFWDTLPATRLRTRIQRKNLQSDLSGWPVKTPIFWLDVFMPYYLTAHNGRLTYLTSRGISQTNVLRRKTLFGVRQMYPKSIVQYIDRFWNCTRIVVCP